MTSDQISKLNDPSRKPFRFFDSVNKEMAATTNFWRNRSPHERLEYLEFMRCVIFGEEAVNAKMIRCYGSRKLNEEVDSKKIVYF